MKRRGTRFFNKIYDETMTQPKRIEAEGNRAKVMMGGERKGRQDYYRRGKRVYYQRRWKKGEG
jgi:hypothetical protein